MDFKACDVEGLDFKNDIPHSVDRLKNSAVTYLPSLFLFK